MLPFFVVAGADLPSISILDVAAGKPVQNHVGRSGQPNIAASDASFGGRLADPNPVAATFFVDDDIARQVNLDGIGTLVDAKHICNHIDDPKLAGADNQAIDQIIAADRIIINKINLADVSEIRSIEARIRDLNATASIFQSSCAKVELEKILGIGAFDLSRSMASADHFLDDHDHQHDLSLSSVSYTFDAAFGLRVDVIEVFAWQDAPRLTTVRCGKRNDPYALC